MTPSAPYEKSKSLGSGGSMVARLKLKGIDGRAPPGVNASFTTFKAVVNSAPKSIRSKLNKSWCLDKDVASML